MPRPIELLAPARNLECGLEAIRHGADAVYIGAERFGARAAAGNSVEDIGELTAFAHVFGARVYVTVNTLLHDDELPAVDALIDELSAVGVDALIVQDERLVELNRGRLPLHASTQMDNRTPDDVRDRAAAGYEQTVLARELSLDEIRAIHDAVPSMPLEVFIHGALCVSYSGRCYASEYCFGRSANRGECAQFCRLPFDLVDADGRIVSDPRSGRPLSQRHLLSLRDLNRSSDLEALMDAGVSSFKIEGRLKDVAYVKNTTAFYRRRLDEILRRRSADFCRASQGASAIAFAPNPDKSFNRRFTDYFLHGRTADLACFATPKAIGEPVGTVKDVVPGRSLVIAGTAKFANGDGLCFLDADDRLEGFRVNRVDDYGRIFPADASVLRRLHKGQKIYRNLDADFERQLSRPTADRRLAVRWEISDVPATGFTLTLATERGAVVEQAFDCPHEVARTPQEANIVRQLLRLGDTPYSADEADIAIRFADNWFIPASVLAAWRRELCEKLALAPLPAPPVGVRAPSRPPRGGANMSSDKKAVAFAPSRGGTCVSVGIPEDMVAPSRGRTCVSVGIPEDMVAPPRGGREGAEGLMPLMTCRYCLRYELGLCRKAHDSHAAHLPASAGEPLALRLADGRTFPLRFDCRRCEMQVLRPE